MMRKTAQFGWVLVVVLASACDDKPTAAPGAATTGAAATAAAASGAAKGSAATTAAAATAAAAATEPGCSGFCKKILACNEEAAKEVGKDADKAMKEMTAKNCAEECGAYDPARLKEIDGCAAKSACGDYTACIVAKGQSCHDEESSSCIDFTGSFYAKVWGMAKSACAGIGKASETKTEFRLGACPTEGAVGTCVDDSTPNQDTTTHYYASGKKSWKAKDAKDECVLGTWKAAK